MLLFCLLCCVCIFVPPLPVYCEGCTVDRLLPSKPAAVLQLLLLFLAVVCVIKGPRRRREGDVGLFILTFHSTSKATNAF